MRAAGGTVQTGCRLAFLGIALAIAACSPSAAASPSPAATPTPTVAPTPSPTPEPTTIPATTVAPTPAGSAAADPALGLTIGAPYTLTALDPLLETSFRRQFTASAGAFASLIGVGGRQVDSNGALVGYIIVIGFPPGIMSDATYQALVQGIGSSSQVAFKKTTISGVEVSTGSMGVGGIGVFRAGDRVLITFTPSTTTVDGVTAALVAANH